MNGPKKDPEGSPGYYTLIDALLILILVAVIFIVVVALLGPAFIDFVEKVIEASEQLGGG